MKDQELVKKLQVGHGEWANEMTVVSNIKSAFTTSDNSDIANKCSMKCTIFSCKYF